MLLFARGCCSDVRRLRIFPDTSIFGLHAPITVIIREHFPVSSLRNADLNIYIKDISDPYVTECEMQPQLQTFVALVNLPWDISVIAK